MGRSAVILIGLLAALVVPSPPALGQEKSGARLEVHVVNGARVYFPASLTTGEKCEKARIGVIRSSRVFEAIPEYREIRKRDLDPDSAEYLLFMKKASDRFKDAITRTARRGNYDLVAECGAVSVKGRVLTDITDEVIRNL